MNKTRSNKRKFSYKPRLNPIALLLGQILFSSAYAEKVIVVDTSQDDTFNFHCSLRNAIAKARTPAANNGCSINGTEDPTVIKFALSGNDRTITLGSELLIQSAVTIQGTTLADDTLNGLDDGTEGITISGNNASRIFRVNAPYLSVGFRNLALKNGRTTTGGALYAQNNSSVSLLNTIISGNSATGNGGGISASGAHVFTYFTSIKNNTAQSSGGGIYARDALNVLIGATVLTQNTASAGNGGAISIDKSRAALFFTQIDNNHAPNGHGGGLHLNGSHVSPGALELFLVTISGNHAGGTAGMHLSDSGAFMRNISVEQNISANSTGGLFFAQSNIDPNSPGALLLNSSVSRNTGGNGGAGGITASNANFNLAKSSVTNNYSGNVGGIYSAESTLNLTNSTISSNTASTGFRGGIYAQSLNSSRVSNSLNLINVTVANNKAIDSAISHGGIHVKNGGLVLLNSIASGNSQSNCTLQNSTIFTSLGENLFGQPAVIDNCILSMPVLYQANALINTDPLIQPLGDTVASSGGSFDFGIATLSASLGFGHELSPVSPAINAANAFICNQSIDSDFVLAANNTGGSFSGFDVSGEPLVYRTSDLILNQSDQRARAYVKTCDLGAMEYEHFTTFFAIPLPGGKSITIPL